MMIYCYLGDLRVATELDTLTRTGETGFSNDEPGFVRVGAIKFILQASSRPLSNGELDLKVFLL